MTNKEAIEILQYMRHDVLANSNRDIALVKAIEALSVDISTLNPSDGDVIVARIDTDHIYDRDVAESICKAISRRLGDTPVIFIDKNMDFTVKSKSDAISELQGIISELRGIIDELREEGTDDESDQK